eukprot:847941-Pyramimonas_sp.AAC.1
MVLEVEVPGIHGENEEWRSSSHASAVVAKDVMGLLDVLGTTFGNGLNMYALDRARAIGTGMRERADEGLATLTEADAFADMIYYQRIAWHTGAFLVEAESDAAELLVKINVEGGAANFRV